jgi:transposase InsO family protein
VAQKMSGNDSRRKDWLVFSGNKTEWPVWSERFGAKMRKAKLYKTLVGNIQLTLIPARPIEGASQDDKDKFDEIVRTHNDEVAIVLEEQDEIYCELVMYLDSESLMYIRHDCKRSDGSGDGTKAWDMLNDRFASKEKPAVMAITQQLTNLRLTGNEPVSNYLLRSQELLAQLRSAGEVMSDSLVNSFILQGLPPVFESFVTMEDTQIHTDTRAAKQVNVVSSSNFARGNPSVVCFKCNGKGHRARECRSENVVSAVGKMSVGRDHKPQCTNCNKSGHTVENCWSKGGGSEGKGPKFGAKGGSKAMCASSQMQYQSQNFHAMTCAPEEVHVALKVAPVGQSIVVDSGCTDHMLTSASMFSEYHETSGQVVRSANCSTSVIAGHGTVDIVVKDADGQDQCLSLKNALHVPEHGRDLLSVKAATRYGNSVLLANNESKITLKDGTVIPIECHDSLFVVPCKPVPQSNVALANVESSQQGVWHRRMGHVNDSDLSKVLKSNGVPGSGETEKFCEPCAMGKLSRKSVPKTTDTRATEPLGRVYTDVAGPFKTSLGGCVYAISFIDDYSRFVVMKFMRAKSEALLCFEEYVNEYGAPKRLRSDNGGEYISEKFEEFCRGRGIHREYTVPETPEQNGVAERYFRTSVEMARCLLLEAKLPVPFWVRAMDTAVYTRNRCVSKALDGDQTPYDMFRNAKGKINHMRVFGCNCYVHKRKWHASSKFDSKAYKAKFVGYDCRSTAYLVYNYATGKIDKVRNVKFNEDDMTFQEAELSVGSDDDFWDESLEGVGIPNTIPKRSESGGSSQIRADRRDSQVGVAAEPTAVELVEMTVEGSLDPGDEGDVETRDDEEEEEVYIHLPVVCQPNAQVTDDTERPNATGRPRRNMRPPQWTTDYLMSAETSDEFEANSAQTVDDSPTSFEIAMASQDKASWQAAMKAEMKALKENETWELVPRPKGRNVVGGKWVYKVKRLADGSIEKYKARYVARGFSQVPGLDYKETYAPTARPETIRLIFALTAQLDCVLEQMDVKSAYLHSAIDEEVYLDQPKGFEEVGNDGTKLVCRLKKSIYGLKQAGHNWNRNLNSWLVSQGFNRSESDRCLYCRREGSEFEYVVIWVDDIVICGSSKGRVDDLKKEFSKAFKMEDKGQLHWFLGMEITRKKDVVEVRQKQYVNNMLVKYQMVDCKSVSTPGVEKESLTKAHCPQSGSKEQERMRSVDYRGVVGGLLYLAVYTRPDIAFAVGALSQFLDNPGWEHWVAAKRVLRYLKGTAEIGLTYRKDKSGVVLIGASDADWSGNVDDRRSTSGYSFHIQRSSAAISWRSTKQPVVALSSTEAEYVSMSVAAQEAVFLRAILKELGFEQQKSTVLLQDNQGAICLSKNPGNHKRTKHIDIRHHYIRDLVSDGIIIPQYVSTEFMEADVLTKNLGRIKMDRFRDSILG